MENKIVPITLLTGYLGAGKTTLINHVLNNKEGYKVAVIVNDIGEINIDATLIQKGGVVNEKDADLVPLQNGCICCTLKVDLMKQIVGLIETKKFDYILIEASGICEPIPIAQTITVLEDSTEQYGLPKICRLDNVVTVVDALRLAKEFNCGDDLERKDLDEEDIENLLIQQMEFCNTIILNKVSEVSKEELDRVRQIVRALQPKAKLIETDFGKVDVSEIINTNNFDLEEVATSAGWAQELNKDEDDDDDDDDHDHEEHHEHHDHHDEDDDDDDDDDHDHEEHHHHHHHHHDHDHEGGEVEEYGIGTFSYLRRKPFDRLKFEDWCEKWFDKRVIRSKGLVWFKDNNDMSYIFEQAGTQKKLDEAGEWLALASKEEIEYAFSVEPSLEKEWDSEVGDRMIKLVFIGQKMDKEGMIADLDKCLVK